MPEEMTAMTAEPPFPVEYLTLPNEPVALLVPRLHRQSAITDLEHVLAGEPHSPVVYFTRIGRGRIKIGTSTNLRARMRSMCLDLDDVLALVPGDRHVESAYHHRFGRSHLEAAVSTELFGLDIWLRLYLARCRWTWHEVVVGVGAGQAVMIWALPFTYGTVPLVLGALASAAVLAYYFTRPGWNWRPRPRIWRRRCQS